MTARLEFPRKVRVAAFARSGGKCEQCAADIRDGRCEYDHILPAALTGQPVLANCRVLCIACHKAKTAADVRGIRKADRQRAAHVNAKPAPRVKIANRGFQKRERERVAKPTLAPRSLYHERRASSPGERGQDAGARPSPSVAPASE